MADFTFVEGNVPSAATWNTTVKDQLVTICTSSTRPASPVAAAVIFETDTSRYLRYVGAAWVQVGQIGAWTTYTPSWTSSGTAPALGNGTVVGAYQRLYGRTWLINVTLTFGSTTTFGTGKYLLTLPTGCAVNSPIQGIVEIVGTSRHVARAEMYGGYTNFQMRGFTSTTNFASVEVTGTVPVTLASGNIIRASLVVESQSSS